MILCELAPSLLVELHLAVRAPLVSVLGEFGQSLSPTPHIEHDELQDKREIVVTFQLNSWSLWRAIINQGIQGCH